MKRASLILAFALLSAPALGKPTKQTSSAPHKTQSTPVAERAPSQSSSSSSSSSSSPPSSSSDSATTTTTAANGKTVKTKTYTFGAMDVEGKLKTPQLLYFLNRVKLELDMSAPDKRSFMKELERSADDKNL
jgi:hypothetical protein